jgi:hypothetical protein
MVDR